MKKLLSLLFCISIWSVVFSQNHHDRFESIDVQHYIFEIQLNDSTDCIKGKTKVSIQFLKPTNHLVLDLASVNSDKKGMLVESVQSNNEKLVFQHVNNRLEIVLNNTSKTSDTIDFEIVYSGVPIDGLVISKNKYNERTFFGDNWPDRAKHWLPCVDHPSDKATLEFKIFAPAYYKVISNGKLVEKKQLNNVVEFTHWKEEIPLPTKLMVIGAANFAVGNNLKYKNISVSSWVFEQNKDKALENYKYGNEALEFFSELIGPYSYEKLAHVQSKTRYGGMENAGCIFYHENTGISNQSQECLFAHEVAHQWFGNSVTEQNWHHVWLSEGFATYLTHVYQQHFYGQENFISGLKDDRERVIRYAQRNLAPIIDTTVTEYIRLLNANSYQKASWFLHMLRMDLGDELFFNGLQKYYSDYRNSTALTKNFLHVMETVSGKQLDQFFKQWLKHPGHPILDFNWQQNSNKEITIELNQIQDAYLFIFPLEIQIQYEDGTMYNKSIFIDKTESNFTIPVSGNIKAISLDPNTNLLFEGASQ